MARYLAVIAISVVCASSAAILRQSPYIKDLYPVPEIPQLFKRDGGVSTDPPFRRDFNLTTGVTGEEILVQRDDGLLISCTDCQVQGQFALEMDFDIDEDLLNELSAALLPQLSTLESSVLSVATSVAEAGIVGASSIVGQAVPIATSIVQKASEIAHSVVASAASPVVSAVAEATADAASIVSEAADGIKSAIPFLGNLFDRRRPQIISRDVDTLIPEVLKGFNIAITQQSPIIANFNLDIRTGKQAVEVDLPPVAFGSLPAFSPSTIKLGVFELEIILSPLALTSMISMQSNTNLSLSFGAGLTLKEPLTIAAGGLQVTGIDATSRFSDPSVSAQDPALCISAALGPAMKFVLSIPSANVGVDLAAQLEVPRISTCFEKVENVDDKCQPNGPIADAMHIDSTLSVGVSSEIGYALPASLDVGLPDPPQLPQISAVFPRFDKCLDLGATT